MELVDSKSFKEQILEKKGVVVIDFFATWCGPCKTLSPIMEELSAENKNPAIRFAKIDVDQNGELAGLYGVMSIPTVVILKDGKFVTQFVGVQTKETYRKASLDALAYKAPAKPDVTLFTTPTCPYCHLAKAYFKEQKIAVTEIDVTKDNEMARKMIDRSGEMGVPQIWINGQVVIGFNKPQIELILGC